MKLQQGMGRREGVGEQASNFQRATGSTTSSICANSVASFRWIFCLVNLWPWISSSGVVIVVEPNMYAPVCSFLLPSKDFLSVHV